MTIKLDIFIQCARTESVQELFMVEFFYRNGLFRRRLMIFSGKNKFMRIRQKYFAVQTILEISGDNISKGTSNNALFETSTRKTGRYRDLKKMKKSIYEFVISTCIIWQIIQNVHLYKIPSIISSIT